MNKYKVLITLQDGTKNEMIVTTCIAEQAKVQALKHYKNVRRLDVELLGEHKPELESLDILDVVEDEEEIPND